MIKIDKHILMAVTSGIVAALSENRSTFDSKYQIVSEGSDSNGNYWVLGNDVTNQFEGSPGTYICWLSYNKCTIQLNHLDIHEDLDSYELRVYKDMSSYPTRGTFYPL